MATNNTSTAAPAAADWSLYPYDPVKPLPYIFAVIIGVLLIVNVYQNWFKYRWKYFGFIMVWASACWLAGFITRALSQYRTQDISLFICQFVFIIMGPPLYAASEVFILGRLMGYLPYHAPMHPGRVLSTFIILSAIIESLTGNGAAKAANLDGGLKSQRVGLTFVNVALVLQAVLEVSFISLTAYLHQKARKANTYPRQVRLMIYIIYLTSSMVLVRCITRAIEGYQSAACLGDPLHRCGTVATHEVFLWVFEVANITLFVIIFTIFTPGRYLPHSDKVYLDPVDGQTERLGPGFSKADKRPFLVTVLDPFDFAGILTGKGMTVHPFWNDDHPVYVGQEVADTRKSRHIQPAPEIATVQPKSDTGA